MTKEGFTVKETAEYFGVSDKAVYAWIKNGKIEAIRKSPRLVIIPPSAIERFESAGGVKKHHKKIEYETPFVASLNAAQRGYLADFMTGLFYLMESATPEQESYIKKLILEIVDPKYREKIKEAVEI